MEPNIWGEKAWFFLHTITLSLPENISENLQKDIYIYFSLLQKLLPCPSCKDNYKKHLVKYPLNNRLKTKKDVVSWLVDIHNEVNKMNNKSIMSYKDVITYYKNEYGFIGKIKKYYKDVIILILLIIILHTYLI